MTEQTVLVVIAACFAVVTGTNDGSSILSPVLTYSGLRIGTAMVLLTAGVVLVPLFSTRVAQTFTQDLVSFEGASASRLMTSAALTAIVVVSFLARRGLPTSLGLAMIGAIIGAGLGSGTGVEWVTVVMVMVIAAAAPLVGGGLAFLVSIFFRVFPPAQGVAARVTVLHRAAFGLICVAYGLNGGQKMLAVLTLAVGAGLGGRAGPSPMLLGTVGACFMIGTTLGLPRVGLRLSNGLYAVRLPHAVAAEVSAGLSASASAMLGAPVSMTQAITGGLVGAGVATGPAQLRWKIVTRMGLAWVFTLPTSVLLGMLTALLAGQLR